MAKRDSNFNPLRKRKPIGQRGDSVADWLQANGDLLKRAIANAALYGGALRFGYSRDGGAYAIGIYGDGDPYTVFFKPNEDIDVVLTDIGDLFEELMNDRGSAPAGV